MTKQITSHLLMVRPASFGFNEETAIDNAFQSKAEENSLPIGEKAVLEFERAVEKLRTKKITVHILEDLPHPRKPDAIFPNNWFSTHQDGTLVLYPMKAANRRLERRQELLSFLQTKEMIDFSRYEKDEQYLEGTGSLVLDRVNRVAYASLSARTSEHALHEWAKQMQYEPVVFESTDRGEKPIYHTNVMMSVGEHFAVICLEAIKEPSSKQRLLDHFKLYQKEVIEITLPQMGEFAGNLLQVESESKKPFIVLSQRALRSLTLQQRERLAFHGELLDLELDTIEKYGGGSARCMLAELFIPTKNE